MNCAMRGPTGFLPALMLGVVGVVSTATPSLAIPIVYTEQATASGRLGGVAFTGAAVTLTMTNDTTNVTGSAPIFVNVGALTVNVTGVGTGIFTDATQAVANQTFPVSVSGTLRKTPEYSLRITLRFRPIT
jgi:hypothetical protein